MDVVVKHSTDLSDISALENLFILIRIPEKFVPDAEVSSELENFKSRDITVDTIEFSGKAKNINFTNAKGLLELDTNSNLLVDVNRAQGKIDMNQVHAISKISFADGTNYYLKNIGRFTHFVDSDSKIISGKGKKDAPEDEKALIDTDVIVELNGWKSEVQIVKSN